MANPMAKEESEGLRLIRSPERVPAHFLEIVCMSAEIGRIAMISRVAIERSSGNSQPYTFSLARGDLHWIGCCKMYTNLDHSP